MRLPTTKMAEQTELQQVMTKDPKKVEEGMRLAEYNHSHRKREKLAKAEDTEDTTSKHSEV